MPCCRFLLKEAAYLAVLKAEMESPDSPGEHVLQLLRHADKAWMTVDRWGGRWRPRGWAAC